MSAIAGIYNYNKYPIQVDYINLLLKQLEEFPANSTNIFNDKNLFFMCHAQWITPESIGECLPYYDQEKRIAITSDAIIDNRDELFEKLNINTKIRDSIPDSQLILIGYTRWGEELPKYLIGEYAFMIWDEQNQKIFGARDFSGSRTLYYYENKNVFAFCTIMKPLLALPIIKKEIDEQWFAEYIAIPGMNDTVDTSITTYKHIKQVPPSHTISIEKGRIRVSRYNILSPLENLVLNSDEDYVEAFQEVFQSAITSRLRTFHNVGSHLSGGLDSGAVTSFAARKLQEERKLLHTFSYVPSTDFQDWTPRNRIANEKPFIESTVNHIGNIKDHYHDFNEVKPLEEIDDWLKIVEMPYKYFGNTHWIKGIFEKAYHNNLGVLLNGGRGNLSISWGPALYFYATLLKKMKWIHLLDELNKFSNNVGGNRLRLLPTITKIAFPTFSKNRKNFRSSNEGLFINPNLADRTKVYEKLQCHGMNVLQQHDDDDIYEKRKRHFEDLYAWNATGTLGTKLSLRYSLWKRDPTNDIRVIRFCLAIPESQYVKNGMDRALIRRATENYLPDTVRLNQRIRGAQGVDYIHRLTPDWDSFVEEVEQLKNNPILNEFINMRVLNKAFEKVRHGPRAEYSLDQDFWILMRSIIMHRYIKNYY
ncbi:asparagine synthetase B [Sutcliffiella horikoshii]|uniref:asparagine synthase (glutamine-hydrolyzing) n=1 Tax=Sutcliffiella horikoshii TaxID=79883 RepID=A0AA94WRY6_9BACI|nr:asparagine synthase-related protein [Sutcliffiella horikoshii]TYS60087.1 asparagine synthetase B [Sutcliffiella horikoshii]